jgi:hypothetical protein
MNLVGKSHPRFALAPGQFSDCLRIQLKEMDLRLAGWETFTKA